MSIQKPDIIALYFLRFHLGRERQKLEGIWDECTNAYDLGLQKHEEVLSVEFLKFCKDVTSNVTKLPVTRNK